MSRPSFNVLTEPWIPVIRVDGSREEVGIMPCLRQAHEIREIRDPSPIVEFGLYRLLVAFVLDALIMADQRPEDPMDLRELIREGSFPPTILDEYVAACGDVFDLFDPDRPFLQDPRATGEAKSTFDFYPVFPTGANVVHFAHQTSADQVLSATEYARQLTSVSPFNVKVKTGSPRTIVGDPPVYALPAGNTLFETILLNVPLPRPTFTRQQERDLGPLWRTCPNADQATTTPCQSFTWPCRSLCCEEPKSGLVTAIRNAKGLSALRDWQDPSSAVFLGDDKTRHLRIEEGHPLWLDAGPLALLRSGVCRRWSKERAFVGPEVVANASEAISDADLRIRFYGLRTDQAKVFEWTKAAFRIPVALRQRPRVGALVMDELSKVDTCAWELRSKIRQLYPREGAGNKSALGNISSQCERAFWQQLEQQLQPLMIAFARLSDNAPDDPDLIKATAKPWREAIERTIKEQFERAAKDMDSDSDALERQVRARGRLHNSLRKHLT